ncbi:MAG TPA: hypothetical protein VFH29_01645, partial [Anaerolineales bacterium]|nr:hypothetical protein [Anaerolineales bacterium]
YYLERGENGKEGALRAQVQLYLDENGGSADSIDLLLHEYPEIRSVVMERHAYREAQETLDRILSANGFSKEPVSIMGTAVFIK